MPPFSFDITPELIATGHKYRRELLAMIPVKLAPITSHMTVLLGIQGKLTFGTSRNRAQLRPYRSEKDETFTGKIDLREIETYLGDVVEEFDPNLLWATTYGSIVGTKPDKAAIALNMGMRMVDSVGENLAYSSWVAKRKPTGNTTMDLFDGFETILDKDIASGGVSVSNKNLVDMGDIDSANVIDYLKAIWRSAHEVLRQANTKMFLPQDVYDMYNDSYQITHPALPYNTEYKKTVLEGTDGKCELVPMTGMSNTRIILTKKQNMLVGMDQQSGQEQVEFRRPDNPKVVQLFMLSYFGVQYLHIDPREFCAAKIRLA